MAKKETKLIEIKVSFEAGIAAIAKGQEAIKNLTAEQKQLNLATAEGVKRNAEITAAIKSHTNEINQLMPAIAKEIKTRGERAAAIDRHVQAEVDLINKTMAKRNAEIAAKEKEYARFNQRKIAEAQKENELAVTKEQAELKKQNADKRSDVLAAVSAKKKEGYINQLKITVNDLEQEYYQLTEAELKSAKGTELLSSLKNKRTELMQLQQAYGNHTLNVGNYSSATKMLGINIGQVMKEMPNFAISARIGIMSLTNNLPMLAETIKQVRVEQLAMIEAGKKAPSMFSLISKSVFGLTGVMSILMVLMQIYGADLIKMAGNLFKANSETQALDEASKNLQKTLKEGNNFYTDAIEKIERISTMLKLAEEGSIDSKAALDEYNTSLGDTFGNADSLAQALQNIDDIKVDYINGLISMTVAQDLLTNAINKSSEALSMERKGKPGFWDYLKQIALNPFGEGNFITRAWVDYFEKINNLRNESAKGVDDYFKEIKKISEQYKNDPFILQLLGLSPKGKKEEKPIDYKNTPEWKAFSDAYDARRDLMKKAEENQEAMDMVALDLQRKLGDERIELTEEYIKKQEELFSNAISKGSKLLEDSLKADEWLADKSVDAQVRRFSIEKQNRINFLNDQLETVKDNAFAEAEIKRQIVDQQMKDDLAVAYLTEEQKTAITQRAARQRQEIEKTKWMAVSDMAYQVANGIAELLGKETKAGKFAAASAVGIQSAQSAFKTGAIAAQYYATGNIPMGILATAQTALIVANGIKAIRDIYAVKDDVSAAAGVESSKRTITEKFHSGGTIGTTTGEEKPITALTGESVNTIATTQMFSPILSALNQIGGGKAITSGVNTSMGTDMLAAAFSKALRQMPAPRIIWSDFETASERQRMIENNRLVR